MYVYSRKEITLNHSTDTAFIKKLTKVVEANLADENFGVKELADKIHMSRSQIHRRLKKINHKSVSQFIREIRLKKAKEMLQEDFESVAEIAYKVGFRSPTYFNSCFHEYFGYPPGEYKNHIPEILEEERGIHIESVDKYPNKSLQTNWKRKGILIPGILLIILSMPIFYLVKKLVEPEKSIIVLPFKNYTNDSANQVIASGLMEDILNSLYWVSDLEIKSRTTSEYFKDSKLSVKQIAEELDVNYILEGSIRIKRHEVIINAQLIDAKTDAHIWSERFELKINNILGIQNEIALSVAKELNATISIEELKHIEKIPTTNKEAYDAFLKGRFFLNQSNSINRINFDKDALLNSISFFEKAVEIDSNYIEAYAGLAHAYFILGGFGLMPVKKGFIKLDSLVTIALNIDNDYGPAHALKAAVYFWGERFDYDKAYDEFKRAIELDPNFSPLYQWYAQLLMIIKPIEEARKNINVGIKLEPYYWINYNLSAYIHYFEGMHKEAIADCEMAMKLNKNYIFNKWLFFLNYLKLGEDLKAVEELLVILESNPRSSGWSNEVMDVYNVSGIDGVVRWVIDLNSKNPGVINGLRLPYHIAWLCAILGDKEQCLFWLQKKPVTFMTHLIVSNPDFDFLRTDPQFLEIIDDFGLTPYHTRKVLK